MIGRALWPILVVLLIAFLLSEMFPGKRGTPIAPAIATMEWSAPASAAPYSLDEVTDVATCANVQRQIAQRRDIADNQVTLACRRPRAAAAL